MTSHTHAHLHTCPSCRWLIRHTAADYKTGKLYGQRPPLVIASFLYPELEAYINEFRWDCGG
jgi:hypothetical protein